jgi:hypothetical protein
MMEEVVDQLMYVNSNNEFYIMMEGVIWKINLKTKEIKSIAEGAGSSWFKVSADNSIVAWVEGGNDLNATGICVLNMESGEQYTIDAKPGYYVRPMGFVQNDLILNLEERRTDYDLEAEDLLTCFR